MARFCETVLDVNVGAGALEGVAAEQDRRHSSVSGRLGGTRVVV